MKRVWALQDAKNRFSEVGRPRTARSNYRGSTVVKGVEELREGARRRPEPQSPPVRLFDPVFKQSP